MTPGTAGPRAAGPRGAWSAASGWARRTWPAATGTGAAASAALALLVLVCAFVAMAVPRASLGYRTQVLQRTFRATPAAQSTVIADGAFTGGAVSFLDPSLMATAQHELAAGLSRDGLPLAPPAARWDGLSTGSNAFSGGRPPNTGAPPAIELMYRGGLARNAVLVAGSLPRTMTVRGNQAATFQVAVSTATAAKFGLHIGTRLSTFGQILVVTGIVRPRHPASSFWTVAPVVAAPELIQTSTAGAPYWSGAAFVGTAGLAGIQDYLGTDALRATWAFPLSLGSVNADQAAGLLANVQALSFLPAAAAVSTNLSTSSGSQSFNGTQGASSPLTVTLADGLVTVLPSFVATDDAVQRALSLLFISLAVIAAVVVLLGARLVAEHRHTELAMMRARGASLRQIARVALAGGAAAALPAAVIAVAAAVLVTPGPAALLSWWLVALIVVTALAGPPLLAVWAHRTRPDAGAGAGKPAITRRRVAAARRWVFDAALVAAAVGGLVLLRQQGLPPPGSVDLFTSAAPVLVAVPVAVLIMRAYPVVLRQLTRLAGRRRGVVLVVGLARGNSAAQAGALPTFALVLAFTVVAFAAMARGAVQRADEAASWQATGADAVVTAPTVGAGITPAAQRLIGRVPGVQRFATISLGVATAGTGLQLPAVIVDPRQYAAMTAATPAPPFPGALLARPPAAGGAAKPAVPVLLSAAGRDILGPRGQVYLAGRQFRFRVAGTLNSIPGALAGSQFVVVPRWALGALAPTPSLMTLQGPQLDAAALAHTIRHTVPGATITLRSRVQASIADAPLPHGGFVTFAQGAAAAAGFSLLVLALTLVLSARSRELTLARLVTMGLGAAQSRRITAVEILPAIVAAALGGTACALALVPLVGPAVDLAAFTGTPVAVPLRAEPLAIAAAAGGLLLLAALTLAVQYRLARSRGAAQALRVGQ